MKKRKKRNYSFRSSKKIPLESMTEVNGVKIPSIPGTCYHAIMSSLAESRDAFCSWTKIYERTEKYMRQFGGDQAWEEFRNKKMVKEWRDRIKENTHTLTRVGKDCYGKRLHERGATIYFFKDGAMLLTGGKFKTLQNGKYTVIFPDGRRLQSRYRGNILTYREYIRFVEIGYVDKSCRILEESKIRVFRQETTTSKVEDVAPEYIVISIILDESYDQNTARRLQSLGLVVMSSNDKKNEIVGKLPAENLSELLEDADVLDVAIK